MRIAVLTHDDSANAYYRAHVPMGTLAQRGHEVVGACIAGPREVPPAAALEHFDVVYVWRLFYEPIWRLARALRERGVGIVWDNDDDMTELPRISPAYRQYGGPAARRTLIDIKAMMAAAHVVTTPSEGLAQRLRALGAEPVVVENYLPAVLARPARTSASVVIGWTASMEHRRDWDQMGLAAVLRRLMDEHPQLVVKSIGVRLGFDGPRYEHARGVPVADLLHYVAHFDIGIAPLLDIPFNRARSNVKLKEYAAAGAAWVASDVGPYRGMGEREGGIVVDEGGWYDALSTLVVDAKRRRKLAASGAKWARTQVVGAHVGRWEQVLGEAVVRARSGAVASAR